MYLYRAIDSQGNSLDFHLSPTRDALAAECFFRKVLGATHTTEPWVINVDKNAVYPCAFATLKQEQTLPTSCQLRQVRYLNNRLEQDHRFIKRRMHCGLGFFSFASAAQTLAGYESMNMIRKGQVKGAAKRDIRFQVRFIHQLSGINA